MKNFIKPEIYAYGLVFLLFFSCKKDVSINRLTVSPDAKISLADVDIASALNIAGVFKVPVSIKGAPPNIASKGIAQKSPQKTLSVQNNSTGAMVDAIDFSKKAIEKYFTVKDMDSVAAMYIINYKGGGFLVVSASKKEHPILAYSDDNSFPQEIMQTNHPINAWLASSSGKIRALRKKLIKNKDSILVQSEWQKYNGVMASTAPTNGRQMVRVPQCGDGYHWDRTVNQCVACPDGMTWNGTSCQVPVPPPCQVEYTVGPLVQTLWDQGCGYNTYTPTDNDGNDCYHTFTGCEATAIAQILKFWHFGSIHLSSAAANGTTGTQTYNYSDATMPLIGGSNETARLMRDVGNAVGMSYGGPPNGSGADPNHPIFFWSVGFTSPVAETDYNTNDVLGEISYGRPCMLGGFTYAFLPWNATGHEWVCDGLHAIPNTCYPAYWSGYSVTVHLNWGWSGFCNGWYVPGSWIPTDGTYVGDRFLHDQTEVVNIWLGAGYPTYGSGS